MLRYVRAGTGGRVRFSRGVFLSCLAVAALVLAGGCAPDVPKVAAPTSAGGAPRAVPKPTNCTQSLTDGTSAQVALDQATPGQRLCIFGEYVQGVTLRLTRSGTATAPIQVVSDGSTLSTIQIAADNVVVEGFNTNGGKGIKARGNNITIRNNDVRNATDDGIRCSPCTNSMIDNNTVKGADGTGILINGQGITAQHNDVSGSVRKTATDADGMRFFGTNLKLLDNTIHDISQRGYPAGTEPHTDCFQTFDSDSPLTYGVLIQNNKCVNVDAQCMIASGTERHNAGVPAGQVAIRFVNNFCQSGAVQAIYLEGYPNVVIQGNTFAAPYETGVLVAQGATNVTISDNKLIGQQMEPYQVDDASRPGFDESNNVNQ